MSLPNNLPQSQPSVSQDSSHPPEALTIILSVACGVVATCILLTIILLLLRHRSSRRAFRQGERSSYAGKSPSNGMRADLDNSNALVSTLDAVPDLEYLPVLHSSSPPSTMTTPRNFRVGELGSVPPLTYPKGVYFDMSRTGMSLSSQPV
ncbi:hypothetical protein BC827DRAFT_1247144, partial [Russula dissimulans]